jgi:hypothetical protein
MAVQVMATTTIKLRRTEASITNQLSLARSRAPAVHQTGR